jgi:hypothetical protein
VAHVHRRPFLPLLLAAAIALPAGCAAALSPAERDAAAVADDAAAAVALRLNRHLPTGDALDVVGAAVHGTDGVEILRADGDVGDDAGAVVVLRVTGHVEAQGGAGIIESDRPEATVVRCYRLRVHVWGGDSLEPPSVACPSGDALDLPVPVPPADPGPAEEARLAEVLASTGDPEAVRATLAAELGDAFRVEAVDVEGAVGVLIGPSSGPGCLLGRRLPDGSVEVWTPPRILMEPGEGGCSADGAARGEAQHPPH